MWYKKVWIYIKKYWQILLGITIAIVAAIFFGKSPDRITDLLRRKNEQADEELQAADKARTELLRQREANLDKYLDAVKVLEEKYKKSETEIKSKTKKKIKKFIKDSEQDPEGIAKRIAEENGWEYIE